MGNDERVKSLLKLAARCEAATGPDRELDRCLFAVLHGVGRGRVTGPMDFPATGSLDAAMSLVPEGKRRVEFGSYEDGTAWAYVHTNADALGESDDCGSEPLAVCAAALRARAMTQDQRDYPIVMDEGEGK